MIAVQQAPAWADLYMVCLTLDEEGDVMSVNVDQWNALDEVRATLGEPFPMEVALLTRERCGSSAWLWMGVSLLRGMEAARLLACDLAEHVLHVYEEAHPDDSSVRAAIRTGREFATGRAIAEDAEEVAWVMWHTARVSCASEPECAAVRAVGWAVSSGVTPRFVSTVATLAVDAATTDTASAEAERRWQAERAALYVAGVLP